jgi:EF hand
MEYDANVPASRILPILTDRPHSGDAMRPLVAISLLLVNGAIAWADPPARPRGEFLRMWDTVVAGGPVGPGAGWFTPAQARYAWDRLKVRDKDGDGRITFMEFGGPAELFAVLDRDGDGAITVDDLDWSDNAIYFRQLAMAQQLLRRADADGNKKLSREEWDRLFDELAKGKKELEPEDLRRLLYPPTRPGSGGSGGMPSKETLLYGLLTGEIGSGAEGPNLNALAPDFSLKSPDGKTTISLSDFKGKKPVALVFGSFT